MPLTIIDSFYLFEFSAMPMNRLLPTLQFSNLGKAILRATDKVDYIGGLHRSEWETPGLFSSGLCENLTC
jgi:hypothetical protein